MAHPSSFPNTSAVKTDEYGKVYGACGGEFVTNLGCKTVKCLTRNGKTFDAKFQVGNKITKNLLAVSQLCSMGFSVIFGPSGRVWGTFGGHSGRILVISGPPARSGAPRRRGSEKGPPKRGREGDTGDRFGTHLGPHLGSGRAPFGVHFRVCFLDRFGVRSGRSPGPTWRPSGVPIWPQNGPKTDPGTEPKTDRVRDPLRDRILVQNGCPTSRKIIKIYWFFV